MTNSEPVLWTLKWPNRKKLNHFTVFQTKDNAEHYASMCLDADAIEVVPLYTRPPNVSEEDKT